MPKENTEATTPTQNIPISIIPLSFTVERNSKTGKKAYYPLNSSQDDPNREEIKKLPVPPDWQTTNAYIELDSLSNKLPSFAIRTGKDLVVIDCDSRLGTDLIEDNLIPYPLHDKPHYIVQSDKGFRHYYFTPTDYYRNSEIFRETRIAIDPKETKIDILHGRSFVFGVCEGNKTKYTIQGEPLHYDYTAKLKPKKEPKYLCDENGRRKMDRSGNPIVDTTIPDNRLLGNYEVVDNEGNPTDEPIYIPSKAEKVVGYKLTPIPNNIVDLLVSKIKTSYTALDTDFKPLATYMLPVINTSLANYSREYNKLSSLTIPLTTPEGTTLDDYGMRQKLNATKKALCYPTIINMLRLLTPSAYRHYVEPDFDPNRVPDGEGINYLQALSTKLAVDPSVDLDTHKEVITFIATELWEDPLDNGRLTTFLDNIVRQTFSATKKPIFIHVPDISNQPLVSINDNEYLPIYRTLDDDYIIPKSSGSIEVVRGIANFKKTVTSANYDLIIQGASVNIDNVTAFKRITELIKTVQIRDLSYKPTGEYLEDGSLYYNVYKANKYLSIIRGNYMQDSEYLGEEYHPTISKIIRNIMADNLYVYDRRVAERELIEKEYGKDFVANNSRYSLEDVQADKMLDTGLDKLGIKMDMYDKFIVFLAHKLKTLDYSPLVFQLMGNRGIGKSLLMQVLNLLTDSVVEVTIASKNNNFNKDQEGAMFLNEDENKVSQYLIDEIKRLSGKQYRRIEGKGDNATFALNVSTYISTTNATTPLAETLDDRRFITFSGFKADKFNYTDKTELTIIKELEQFSLLLRDTKLLDYKIYNDANQWHDSIHFTNMEERTNNISGTDKAVAVASLIYDLPNIKNGKDLYKRCELIFGELFHFTITKESAIHIVLNKFPKMFRLDDLSPVTHDITRDELKKVGLDKHLKRDTNATSNLYGTAFYKLEIKVTSHIADEFNKCEYSQVTSSIDLSSN